MASWIWVLIPLAAIFAGVVKHWLSVKEREIDSISKRAADEARHHAALTERLEQRVRVLERIVTDRGIDVADEIEKLRDHRPPAN